MRPPHLPIELSKITRKQYRRAVCFLAKKPRAELLREQTIVQAKERAAIKAGDEKAAVRADVMERITNDALFEREFGPIICVPKRKRRR